MKRPRRHNFIERRFGKLLVTHKAGTNRWGDVLWSGLCDCGNSFTASTTSLTKKKHAQVSCGCHVRSILRACHERNTRPIGEAAFDRLLLRYKSNAKRHGVIFELTAGHFKYLTSGDCFYCGAPPAQSVSGFRNGDYRHSGVDRVVPARGYVADNVRSCCKTCNIAKHNLSEAEFYTWIKRVHSHIATFISETTNLRSASFKVEDAPRTGEIAAVPAPCATA